MFRRKRRGRHAAPTPTSAYVVRGALVAGATPALIGATASVASANTGEIPIVEVQASTPSTATTYIVQSGDTLAKIARRNDTTWQDLARSNGISNPDVISVGETINVGDTPIYDGLAQASDTASAAYNEAYSYLGVPYVYGGESRSGLDCSGLVMRAYESVGIALPRTSAAQADYGTPINESDARVGDLVAFSDSHGRVHHVGLYAGNGNVLHSPRSGKKVQVSKIWRSETVNFYRLT